VSGTSLSPRYAAPVRIPSPVVVVGAGFLGARVARALQAHGVPVFATSRRPREHAHASALELRALDILRDPVARIREQLDGARAVVLCYSSGGTQDRARVFVDGTSHVLEACAGLPPERVVYTSSTSALPDQDALLDEDCEAWPEHARGRVQREAERAVATTLEAAAIPWLILRLGGLYGPGRELGRIYASNPARMLAGDGMQPTNLIHVDDARRAVLAALAQPPEITGLIHVCADEHTTRREMYAQAAARAGLPAPRWEREPAPDAPPRGKRVDNTKMKRVLGLALAHPAPLLQVEGEGSPSG
jgi:nucleoside-diphosphate-sugar epimerase